MIAALFAQGHACDLILLVMAIELVVLSRGRPIASVVCALLPGALIVIALRGALTGSGWTGSGWPWIALPLALSLPVHLADLHRRGWLAAREPRV